MKKIFIALGLILVLLLVLSYFKKAPTEAKNQNKSFTEITEINAKQKTPQAIPSKSADQISFEEYEQLLKSDDLCKLEKTRLNFADRVRAFLNVQNPFPAPSEEDFIMKELFEGVLFSDGPASPSALVTGFYNALMMSGLLEGAVSPKIDLQKANALFLDLKARDPKNGIYAFFRAYVLNKLGASNIEVKTEFLEAFQAPEFDSFLSAIASYFHDRGYINPSYFLDAITITSALPVPNFYEVFKLLKTLQPKEDLNFNQQAMIFGQRMIQPGIDADGAYEPYAWVVLEYVVGTSIVKNSASILKIPEKDLHLKKFNELSGYQALRKDDGSETLSQLYISSEKSGENCDRAEFDKYFQRDLERFKNFKLNHP